MNQIAAKKPRYYLTREHFMKMLMVAAAVHIVAGVVWLLSPGLAVNKIPVRVLNIKLGMGELMAVQSSGADRSVRTAVSAQPRPVPPPSKNSRDKVEEEVVKQPEKKAEVPKAKESSEQARASTKGKASQGTTINTSSDQSKSATGLPSQYVRQMGDVAGSGAGSAIGTSAEEAAEITKRYGQLISLWMQKHKVYPADLKRRRIEGSALIRIRLNRDGQILHFKLEKSTGNNLLDDAVLKMVKASNPVPPAPENYPSPNLIEFLVPVNYKLR